MTRLQNNQYPENGGPRRDKSEPEKNLRHECIESLAHERMTPLRISKLTEGNNLRFCRLKGELLKCQESKSFTKFPAGLRALLSSHYDIRNYSLEAPELLSQSISSITSQGLYQFIKDCTSQRIDPLLTIALKSLKEIPIESYEGKVKRRQYDKIKQNYPEIENCLNQISFISARELGLISPRQAIFLASIEDRKEQDYQVKKLNRSLRHIVKEIAEIESKSLSVSAREQRMNQAFAGGNFVYFARRMADLDFLINSKRPLSFVIPEDWKLESKI